MMTTIRIDRDVYRELERRVEGFSDTPNLVLRRLLGLEEPDGRRAAEAAVLYNPRLTGFRRGRPPAIERAFAAHASFRRPILEVLADRGGEARTKAALEDLGRRMQGSLSGRDFEAMSNGEPRWKVTASFERKNLVEEGLLEARTPRGTWRISEKGRAWLLGEASAGEPPGWNLDLGLKAIDRVMTENKAWLEEMANR
jgi:hypothetical protein